MAGRKLTRKEIAAGLEAVPLDTILLGVNSGGTLTPKQREFARNLALGKSKAQSYREAYNSKATSKTQANAGYSLAKRSDIDAIREAYALAIEAAKYRTPAQLRELVIHQLTAHAIDQEVPPAQRIQALKLLGTVSEVAAFTERKEVHTIKHSEDIRGRLIEQLRALTGSASDAIAGEASQVSDAEDAADSLLAELGAAADNTPQPDPTAPPPPEIDRHLIENTSHTIPHSESPAITHTQSAPKSHDKTGYTDGYDHMTAKSESCEINDLQLSPVLSQVRNCTDGDEELGKVEGEGVEIPGGDWDVEDRGITPHGN